MAQCSGHVKRAAEGGVKFPQRSYKISEPREMDGVWWEKIRRPSCCIQAVGGAWAALAQSFGAH